uniref:Zinc finger protein 64like [Megachile rotundata] n=1 Tax=Lepeophtheirus salmonis TaxID=72036 RepID=A0A0K2UXL8_LEPSM
MISEDDSVVKLPSGTHISIIENKDDEDGYLEDYMEIVAIKCKLCDFVGGSRGVLRMHLKETHVRSIPPQDKMLIDGLLSLSAPQSVIEEEEESSVYLCAHCSKPFPNKIQCKIHMQKEHKFVQRTFVESENLKKCTKPNCSYTFSQKDYETHLLCHTNELEEGSASSYSCFKCPDIFDKWGNCALHLWKTHGIDIGLLCCSICDYKTFYSKNLEVHSQTHSEDKPFLCSKCEKSFKQLAQLKNHMVTHLDKEKDVVPSWYAKKKCELCDKLFSDSKCLKKHVQAVHSKLKPYICQVCNHSTSRKAMLKMHMRQHTGEKPYECDICAYKTGDHNSLRRHKYRHTGEKPHKCKFCVYSTVQSSALRRHVTTKHPGKEYYGREKDFENEIQATMN